jgi:hypothetical protein
MTAAAETPQASQTAPRRPITFLSPQFHLASIAADRLGIVTKSASAEDTAAIAFDDLPTRQWSPGTGHTLAELEPSPPGRASLFSPAVPPTCHKQRSQRYLADNHGHFEQALMLGTCR